MSGVTESQLTALYELADECLEGAMEYRSWCQEAFAECDDGESERKPAKRTREGIQVAAKALAKKAREAERAIKAHRVFLATAHDEVVQIWCGQAPTFAEAVVRRAAWACGKTWNITDFVGWRKEARELVFRIARDFQDDVQRMKDEMAIEQGRLLTRLRRDGWGGRDERGLWRIEGGRVVLEGDLAKLKGDSRRLMQYFIQRAGREVTIHDLGVDIWGQDFVKPQTVYSAMGKLRSDLDDTAMIRCQDQNTILSQTHEPDTDVHLREVFWS